MPPTASVAVTEKIVTLNSVKRQRHFDTVNSKMDNIYMKTKNGYTNDSDFVHTDFIEKIQEFLFLTSY